MPEKKISIAGISLILGPLLSLGVCVFADLDPGHPEVTLTAAVALLMAFWWITEAVPLAVTALLPMVLFPGLGIMDGREVAPVYFNHIIFLFLGGFFVALAMERWDLHRRIALKLLLFFGTKPRNLLIGFMTTAAVLSMWISNTATTMVMVPIVLAITLKLEETTTAGSSGKKTAIALLLGVAYGSTLGGIATLVGTPPNLVLVRIFEMHFPEAPEINFAQWMAYALPISLVLLLFVWILLCAFFLRGKSSGMDKEILRKRYEEMGPITYEQKVVLIVFLGLALLWLLRSDLEFGLFTLPGWANLFPYPSYLNDGSVAIAMAIFLFMIPARTNRRTRIMDWDTTKRLPWNIVLLFGGGFALAKGFETSGLSQWLGTLLEGAGGLHPLILMAIVCLLITFLTELTSNTATAQILLPIIASLALAIHIHPLLLMMPATLSCSLAFMLPVATPPNAIIFGSGKLRVADMARIGFIFNLIGVLVVTMATWIIGRIVFEIDLAQLPVWVR
jgi:sodium-dependent dicarboxylate transporter 2/3/5